MTEPQTVRTIDVDMRGQVCPSTLLVAMDNINRHKEALKQGAIKLLIMTDNREATNTIPGAAENMGYSAQVTKQKGYYEILIETSTVEI